MDTGPSTDHTLGTGRQTLMFILLLYIHIINTKCTHGKLKDTINTRTDRLTKNKHNEPYEVFSELAYYAILHFDKVN